MIQLFYVNISFLPFSHLLDKGNLLQRTNRQFLRVKGSTLSTCVAVKRHQPTKAIHRFLPHRLRIALEVILPIVKLEKVPLPIVRGGHGSRPTAIACGRPKVCAKHFLEIWCCKIREMNEGNDRGYFHVMFLILMIKGHKTLAYFNFLYNKNVGL
jgi:hypothetical protein